MIKTLTKVGNSHALVIDKALMEAIGIQGDTPLQITIKGNSMIITPANVGLGKERVDELLKELRPKYRQMLENLAQE